MKYRKLRIAFSAACGIVCVLLIALWARSYTWWDCFVGSRTNSRYSLSIGSARGIVGVGAVPDFSSPLAMDNWRFDSNRLSWIDYGQAQRSSKYWIIDFRFRDYPPGRDVMIPHWQVILAAGLLATIPWMKRRFSLRTLLIATTLVAVGLGVAVMMLSGS